MMTLVKQSGLEAPSGAPATIHHHTRSHCLHLSWPDGCEVRLDTRQLRGKCLCSTCRALKLQGWTEEYRDVDLGRAQPFGVSGLQLVFSDGHDRGVFPWRYLWELGQTIGWGE